MKNILLFIDNKKEQSNFSHYFKATQVSLKLANEMSDFRFYLKNQVVDFILFDSSVLKYWTELESMALSRNIPFLVIKDESFTLEIENSISKPFSFKQIVNKIEETLSIQVHYDEDQAKEFLKENEYTRIKIKDVPKNKTIAYDIHIKINDTKFVKIIRANEPFSWDVVENLKKRGASFVYAKKEEYAKYLESLIYSSKNINAASNVTAEMKLKFLHKTSDLVMDQIYTEGISKDDFFNSKQILDNAMDLVIKDKSEAEVNNLLNSLNEMDESLFRHSFAMSIYSVMIAKNMDFIAETTLFKLSTGALFADIGLRGVDSSILSKNKQWMTLEEIEEYCQHPVLSYRILSKQKDILQDILDIAIQHHENCDGTGYPKKLTKLEIHPLAKIVRLAHEFTEQALKTESNPFPEGPQAIVKKLILSGKKVFDQDCLNALAKLYQLDFKSISNKAS